MLRASSRPGTLTDEVSNARRCSSLRSIRRVDRGCKKRTLCPLFCAQQPLTKEPPLGPAASSSNASPAQRGPRRESTCHGPPPFDVGESGLDRYNPLDDPWAFGFTPTSAAGRVFCAPQHTVLEHGHSEDHVQLSAHRRPNQSVPRADKWVRGCRGLFQRSGGHRCERRASSRRQDSE